jgi:two-component system, chemotaxis family, response regulator PixH
VSCFRCDINIYLKPPVSRFLFNQTDELLNEFSSFIANFPCKDILEKSDSKKLYLSYIQGIFVMTTVLLVEDSLTETQVLLRYLKQAGIAVVTAFSSEEAQLKLQLQMPDLIILDVILPGQSGFELCRELKTNINTKRIPVVICSTKSTEADKLWGTMLGADAYIPKPVDQQQLVKIIQQLISGFQHHTGRIN